MREDTLAVQFIGGLQVVVWDKRGVETGADGILSSMLEVVDARFIFFR